jgi:hypothetical protein
MDIDHATFGLPLCFSCESVRPGDHEYPHPMPCIQCGRELRHRCGHHFAEAFCSAECQQIVYDRRDRRDARRLRRRYGIACAVCRKVFRPRRRGDAVTCSPACRQKLYRRRVTDRAMGAARTIG